MARAERLLDLIQVLRRHRRPVSGATLAHELGISVRTLYRDILALKSQGAPIDGEAGIGYVLRPGFMLPPLMFTTEEIEAIVLGSRWVADRADEPLGTAALDALAKIAAVLPADLKDELEDSGLLIGPGAAIGGGHVDLASLRTAIRAEHKVRIDYRDAKGETSARTIWPFALAFFDSARIIAAWCELRGDFRHFRVDRIAAFTATANRYPRRRRSLLAAWRKSQGIDDR